MTREEWVKVIIKKQPVFDSKDAAIKAAIKNNKKFAVNEVWQEPKERGGRYVVAAPESFETLYREGYKRILEPEDLDEIECGEHIAEIEEAK